MSTTPTTQTDASPTLLRLGRIAALAVALGFGVQILVLAAKSVAGASVPGLTLAVDIAAGVTWSTIVCLGSSLGVTLFKTAPTRAALVAALFAPVAVAGAKAANQTLSAAIGMVGKPAAVPLIALAGIKALEYAVLGYALATLARRGTARLGAFAATGLAVGVIFGGAALALRLMAATASIPEIAAIAVNEVVFPVGCAAVVYAGLAMGRAGS